MGRRLRREEEAFRKGPNLQGEARVKWMYQRYIKDYLGCVQSVDDNIGRVLKHLDDTGLADDTVVIYSSDQGWYLGEHGWYDKRWMYEESLVMPLIVRWPGVVEAGSINNDIVSNLDFAETFLEIAGAATPGPNAGPQPCAVDEGRDPGPTGATHSTTITTSFPARTAWPATTG
ncbi:MAG: hypothetical protein CM1200mP34_5760 [Verrucomicrobiales bacterium]|nr:MAG: hypothetical protein CM1200mP34_5760 [Verrucomicrobiales bacterium]